MLTITNLLGQTEVITKFNNFEMYEETNGSFTLSFTSFPHPQNFGYTLIDQECFVEYEGYEFRIKQIRSDSMSKQVKAVSTYFDNVDKHKYDTYGGTRTFTDFATYVFTNTGWTFVNDDITESVFIPNFGNDNIVKLVDTLKAAFECEMKIEPNKVLRFAKQLGPDNDEQYRYRHNIIALSESVDTTKLKTYIEGFGANGLHVTYTSPLASNSGIGIRHAKPIHDDNFTLSDQLMAHIKKELHDYPESSIELDAVELQEKEIGERVWLIHEKLGIEYQTRIMAKRTRIPNHLSSVVLGNVRPQTVSGLISSQKVELDRSKKETQSKIKQTNDTIVLEVTRLDGDIATANSKITQNADNITLKVSSTDYNGDTIIGKINVSSSTVTIEAANINLHGAVKFTDLDTTTQTTIDGKENKANLSAMAYESMVEDAKLGTTIISGGYIVSKLLTADNITVGTLSGDRITGGIITGSTLALSTGAKISPTGIAGIYISASDIYLADGRVDLSKATSVNWGTHAPVAKFG